MNRATPAGYRLCNILRIERHDLDRVIAISGSTKITLRDELANGQRYHRSDIILVNAYRSHCKSCSCEGEITQFVVEVAKDGTLLASNLTLEFLSPEDLEWAEAEAARMVAVAASHPEFGKAFLR